MSVLLTKACSELETKDLKPIEKFILTTLCFKANINNEAYCCIDKLVIATGACKTTIESALKVLRDKKYLSYTGKTAPKSKRIPVYKIDLIPPKIGVIKNTPNTQKPVNNTPKNWGTDRL